MRTAAQWRALGLSVTTLLAACSGGASSSTPGAMNDGNGLGTGNTAPTPCSPLEGTDAPITLQQVVAAGRHADGTIYVLDRGSPEYRAFVSNGSVLERKKVAGSGTGDGWIVASISDPNAPFSLRIESSGGTVTRMGVYRGELKAKDFDIGSQGEALQLLGPNDYASLAVRNLPPATVVEYDASTTDGHRLVLMRPETDWTYDDFRLFYGTPDRMVEQVITQASRGSSTYLTITMDGAAYDIVLPSPTLGDNRPPTMTGNGSTQVLTYRDADAGALGVGLTYLCR